MADDSAIPAPVSPLTIRLNELYFESVFSWFKDKYLPAFDVVETSGYRSAAHNAEVGGAANSAHVHGLARDFILAYKDGRPVPERQARAVFDEFILPNWPGYALWEGDHVHVNLSRKVTTAASVVGVGLVGWGLWKLYKSFGEG